MVFAITVIYFMIYNNKLAFECVLRHEARVSITKSKQLIMFLWAIQNVLNSDVRKGFWLVHNASTL